MPGRSTSTARSPAASIRPSRRSTVTPAQLPTCWLCPVSRLNRVVLPQLGLPASATVRIARSSPRFRFGFVPCHQHMTRREFLALAAGGRGGRDGDAAGSAVPRDGTPRGRPLAAPRRPALRAGDPAAAQKPPPLYHSGGGFPYFRSFAGSIRGRISRRSGRSRSGRSRSRFRGRPPR